MPRKKKVVEETNEEINKLKELGLSTEKLFDAEIWIDCGIQFIEEALGTLPDERDVLKDFVQPHDDSVPKETLMDELDAVEIRDTSEDDADLAKVTVFPRFENGEPFSYDYQWKGFFKDSCGMLRDIKGMKSSALKAYKKKIDGQVIVEPRKIPFFMPEGSKMGISQRPLRASTAQGERIAIATSETIPEGTKVFFRVIVFKKEFVPMVKEWLLYGVRRGTFQWRNSGKGRFKLIKFEVDGEDQL